MNEDQVTIPISGVFGEKAAGDLTEAFKSMRKNGKNMIHVDFSRCSEVFAEGVMTLSESMKDLFAVNDKFTIHFDQLNEKDSNLFLLFGFPVNGRQFTLPEPRFVGNNHQITTVCEKCGSEIQTDSPGLFRCPVCHSHFHLDHQGRTTFYDSIREKEGEV